MELLYRDGEIAVCIKPAGLLSEGDGEDSVLTHVRRETGGEIYPVHRLDRGTAGIMVFARTRASAAALSEAIRKDLLQKEYLALVSGCPAEKEGRLEDYLFKDSRKNKVFPVKTERKGAKYAALRYRVLWTKEDASLVRVALETGRTHQIRVQFASRGMPLLGDGKYGSRVKGEMKLFACRLTFPHPKTGEPMTFEQMPDWAELC